jgi:hypothetical protein
MVGSSRTSFIFELEMMYTERFQVSSKKSIIPIGGEAAETGIKKGVSIWREDQQRGPVEKVRNTKFSLGMTLSG